MTVDNLSREMEIVRNPRSNPMDIAKMREKFSEISKEKLKIS